MKRLLPLLLILVSLLTGCQQGTEVAAVIKEATKAETSSCVQPSNESQRQAALITDASDVYRVCSSRPQWLLPSQSAKQERGTGKTSGCQPFHSHRSHQKHFCRTGRTESAPFCFVASRDYYIIALRRILR